MEWKEFRVDIDWLMVFERFVGEEADFEIDAFLYWEPVKIF